MTKPKQIFFISETTGKATPNIIATMDYLASLGYRVMVTADNEKRAYKVDGRIVEAVEDSTLIMEICNYFATNPQKLAYPFETWTGPESNQKNVKMYPADILEAFVKFRWGRIFDPKNSLHLPQIEVKKPRHSKHTARYYFRNVIAEVTSDGFINPIEYETLDYFLFKKDIIDKDFRPLTDTAIDASMNDAKCKGSSFIDYVGRLAWSEEHKDIVEPKLEHIEKMIGYLCHEYKERGATDFGVWICDNEAGGTGKDLLAQAINKITSVTSVDCSTKRVLEYDPIALNASTRIKHLQDIGQKFTLREVFNEITDSNHIHHKYGHPMSIDYENGFKFLFTANYFPKSSDSADLRRIEPILVSPYFSHTNRLYNKYGHSFFGSEWSSEDWNIFYNFMLRCVAKWLQCNFNFKKYGYQDKEFQQLKIQHNHRPQIVDFINEKGSGTYTTKGLHADFIEWCKGDESYVQNTWVRDKVQENVGFFGKLVRSYCNDAGYAVTFNSNRTNFTIKIPETVAEQNEPF